MKKLLLLILAVVAVSLYSCTKENQSGQRSLQGTLSTTKIKKDTVPPTASRLFRDTVPPTKLQKDTVPPTKF